MTELNVVFSVPPFIIEGLKDGTFERVGGVVRKSGSKQVVTWLGEIGEKAAQQSDIPSQLPGNLQTLLSNTQIMMGLQVANLAVSAAGFAAVLHKLNIVEQKINEANARLQRLHVDQQWLDSKQCLAHIAVISAGARQVAELQHYENQESVPTKLHHIDNGVMTAHDYFYSVIQRIFQEGQEYQRADELTITYRAWVIAGQLSANIMMKLGEAGVAHERMATLARQHAEYGKKVSGALTDMDKVLHPSIYNESAHVLLKENLALASSAHEILRGNTLQLGFIKEEKLQSPSYQGSSHEPLGLYVVR